jgi:hypothetical protein
MAASSWAVCALIWINHRHRLVLLHPVHDVVAVDQAEGELTARHQIGAVAIARGYLDAILVQALHEFACAFIAQKNKERCDLVCCRAEKRICNHRPATPTRVGV